MRKRDYLFQREGSQNWRVRFQHDGKSVEKSLRTPNRAEAEVLALPLIAQHKAALLTQRPVLADAWIHELEPDREHIAPDGSRIIATQTQLIYLNHNGAVVRTVPNGVPALQITGGPLNVRSLAEAFTGERPTVPVKNGDDALFETYLTESKLSGYYKREAETVWALFKTLCGVKLKDATRDDGRKLVAHFAEQGLKRGTIQKKMAWLSAAANLAIEDKKLRFNPFSRVLPKKKKGDALRRLPLDDADIKNAKRNLDDLTTSDQLLFKLLAATGMRLSEAFQINSEAKERGCRYVIIGQKTEASLRRVPLPDFVPPVKGPLFHGNEHAASNRLNRFLRNIGIMDKAKVVHSLRHRAQDRLRAAECPQDIREALLGHEESTVGESYGAGFSVPKLRKWQAKIGF